MKNNMEIVEVNSDEYERTVGKDVFFFCTRDFLELNIGKVDRLYYLIGRDSKQRFAFSIGCKGDEWMAPFSAPFSSVIMLRNNITVEQIWFFVDALNRFAKEKGAKRINLFLPPNIYSESDNARMVNALLGNGYKIKYMDVNYSFNLENIKLEQYPNSIQRMARKNLRIAMKSDLYLLYCDNYEQKCEAYEIIRKNREYRGFPLRMTRGQLMDTIQYVSHDFFILKHNDDEVASAIVYHVTNEIAQVVYWGNLPDTEQYKPINYLAYELIRYYKNNDFRILDIGPSTEGGEPNYGLCAFKESIGCTSSMKSRLVIDF